MAYVLGHSQARGLVVETQLVAAMSAAVSSTPGVFGCDFALGVRPGETGKIQKNKVREAHADHYG